MTIHSFETIWEFETKNFRVSLAVGPCDEDPRDHFEFPEQLDFAMSDDPAHWFDAAVHVHCNGITVGSDYLGCCSYNSFDEFISGHRDADPENRNTLAQKAKNTVVCHYFPDMVNSAIANARETLARLNSKKLRQKAA